MSTGLGRGMAGVAMLVTLLLSITLGVDWVATDGTVDLNAAKANAPAPVVPAGLATTGPGYVPPPPPPEFLPLPLDYVYLDVRLYCPLQTIPWNPYYSGCRTQHLYLASEIGRGGTIDQIALFLTYAYTYAGTFPNVSVKMCNTTVTSLTTTFSNNYGGRTPTWVFHQDSGFVRGGHTYSWDTVALSTPFNYNGTDNLLVEIVWRGTASGFYSYSWVYNLGGSRRTYAYNITDTLVATGYSNDYIHNTRIGFRSPANDVGVVSIPAPAGLFCFCDTIRPLTCRVRNFGSANQTGVPVICHLRDSSNGTLIYNRTVNVDVASGQTVTVDFPLGPGDVAPRGRNTRVYDTCFTSLSTDVRRYNDTAKSFVHVVQEADVTLSYNDGTTGPIGCYTWTSPNYTNAVRFPGPCAVSKVAVGLQHYCACEGEWYPCTLKVRLNDGIDGMPGTEVWAESLMLHDGGYPNDYINYIVIDPPAVVTTDSFFVTWKPQVVANPFPSFDWDQPIQVGNDFGTMPGSEVFGPFQIGPEGDDDGDLIMNAYYSGFLHDVAVGSIDVPPEVVDSNTTFTPAATFKNIGLKGRPSSVVSFWITDTGGDKVSLGNSTVPGMRPTDKHTIPFPPAVTPLPGEYMDSATITCIGHDADRANDTLTQPLFVRYHDVLCQIVRPTPYDVPGIVPIILRLTNKGNVPAMVDSVRVTISDGYSSFTTGIPLAPGEVKLEYMPVPWVCPVGATSICKAWITCPPDMFHPSDTAKVTVKSGIPGWSEKTPLPAPPSGKGIKDGGCMAYDASQELIYASKGNRTGDFYCYDANAEPPTWTSLAGIPLGAEGKPPYKGSVICSDGNGELYLTKGNNTAGFWGYDAVTNAWTQLTNVPLGSSNKKVKQGAGLAWGTKAGVGPFAYLLKGYRSDFHRYDPGTNTWKQLMGAPVGPNNRIKWDAGSWLVADADSTGHLLYAFKAKYHEFYAYDTDADTWSRPLTPMPIPGTAGNKKAKDGSSAAWYNGRIYAFKGGNTNEFWRYFPRGDTWKKQDDIPLIGMTGARRKVKAGGALAPFPGMGLFAFKGNKSLEFWNYTPYDLAGAQPGRDGITASSTQIGALSFAIAPNPVAGGLATMRYNLPEAGPVTLNVFDVTGRTVLEQTLAAGRSGTAGLDLRKLEAGVYLVKVTAEGFSTTQKLVVQHR